MTVQFTQIPATEPRLLPDTHVQTASENSFQRYLDDEQKRLALMFSPFGQLDLSSWFNYAAVSDMTEPAGKSNAVRMFSDIDQTAAYADTRQTAVPQDSQDTGAAAGSFEEFTDVLFGSQPRNELQDLLQRTGWLTPNLEAQPQMFLAQTQGKLLTKLDMQALIDEIVSQVKLVKAKGEVSLSLGLSQQDLGELLLTLTSQSCIANF